MRGVLLSLLLLVAGLVASIWGGELGLGPVVITKEYEYKIVLRLGNPVQVLDEPGWALRVPLLDTVQVFDQRLQYLNASPVEMVISRGEKLIVDFYVVWRITDPLDFLRNFPGGMDRAEGRIQRTVNALVGETIGGLALAQLLERAEALERLADTSSRELAGTGVSVVDVRLNRTELPRKAEPAAFEQMREQRRAMAREHRVRGERDARQIRAEADRDARTTRARAYSDSEVLRGEGDAKAARIYAEAYGRDPEFYAFVRSLEAYRKTLSERTTLLLPPDHEFFRYLGSGELPRAAGETSPP